MSPPREPPRGPETTLSGVVERILWLDEETHFTIAELAPEAGEKVIILGNMTGLQCGETVDVSGHWERHPSHGPQLRVRLRGEVGAVPRHVGLRHRRHRLQRERRSAAASFSASTRP